MSAVTRRAAVASGLAAAAFGPGGAHPPAWGRDGAVWVTPAAQGPGLTRHVFRSSFADTEVSFHVQAPPGFGAGAEELYPLVVWLHGVGGAAASAAPVAQFFREAIEWGDLPPLFVLLPNGLEESLWCDSVDGRTPVESIVMNEVIPLAADLYPLHPDRKRRLIEGFSMGGFGAARLGFRHHDQFGAVSILGAGPMHRELTAEAGPPQRAAARLRVLKEVFDGRQDVFMQESPWGVVDAAAPSLRRDAKIRIALGARDDALTPNAAFSAHLTDLGIPHSFDVVRGVGHNGLDLMRSLGFSFHRSTFAAS